jgi:hypothetical protein
VTLDKTGLRTVTVGNTSREITIEPGVARSAVSVYRSDDGRVSAAEVADAVDLYARDEDISGYGSLSASDVVEIIAAANAQRETLVG